MTMTQTQSQTQTLTVTDITFRSRPHHMLLGPGLDIFQGPGPTQLLSSKLYILDFCLDFTNTFQLIYMYYYGTIKRVWFSKFISMA